MTRPLRIANCSGFFGDRLSAAREMVEGGPIDVLISDWLDELALLRPPFAMDRLRKEGTALVYRCAKQHREPTADKRGAKVDEQTLTPLELIDRIAALVPPPRTHRHRYCGVLAPNSPLRSSVTAMAQAVPAQSESVQIESATSNAGEGAQIKKILDPIGVDSQAPRTFLAPPAPPARLPPLWDECGAQKGQGVEVEPHWDLAAQPAPDHEIDQRCNW